jgi:hypothetical protein
MRKLMTVMKSFQIDYMLVGLLVTLTFCVGVVGYSFWNALRVLQ